MQLVERNAFHRTHLDALRLAEMTNALGAKGGVNLVNLNTLRDGLVGTHRLADVAVDALGGDLQRHGYFFLRPNRRSKSATTGLGTNFSTGAPKPVSSRTSDDDRCAYCGDGASITVSSLG